MKRADAEARLARLRSVMADRDEQLIRQLAARLDLARDIARAKAELGLPIRDHTQEERTLERAALLAADHGLDPHFARRLVHAIMEHCRSLQYRGFDDSTP